MEAVVLVHVLIVHTVNMNIQELETNVFTVDQVHTVLAPIVLRKHTNMNLVLESVVIVDRLLLVHAPIAHQKSMSINRIKMRYPRRRF